MPDDHQDDPVTTPSRPRRATPVSAPEETVPVQQRYPASRLRTDASILGASTPVLAAAFADADVRDDDMLTRDEAEKLIAASQARPVPPAEEA